MIVGLEHNDFTFYSIRKNSSHLKLLTAHSVLFLLARSLIHSACAVRGCNCCGIGAVNYGREWLSHSQGPLWWLRQRRKVNGVCFTSWGPMEREECRGPQCRPTASGLLGHMDTTL